MASQPPPSTGEREPSKSRVAIINEAQRIEEDSRHSSGGHFAAAHYWSHANYWLGIPNVLAAGLAGASFLSKVDSSGWASGILSLIVLCLSSLMTFLNPHDKASAYLSAGNQYDALMNRARIFHSIDCWKADANDEELAAQLKDMSDKKSKLNESCPQIPRWAYEKAKKRIEAGERTHQVDTAA